MTSSKTEDVYETLKHEITHFLIPPGERLLEERLSERFGSSRTPIREVLQRLEQEGFVIAVAGGRIVQHPSEAEFEDIYQVRLALERLAVAQACERASDRGISRLRESWPVPAQAEPNVEAYRQADERFHLGVAQLARNDMLISSLGRINDRISVLRQTDYEDLLRVDSIRVDHDSILDAIQERDTDRAVELIEAHISDAKSNIRRLLYDALAAAMEH